MMMRDDRLRVALVAGTLGKGGAETQLLMVTKALTQANVDVRVYCSTRGEFYESYLGELGCEPIWYGRWTHPLCRLIALTRLLHRFRPHVIQSAHFYTNLYAAIAGQLLRSLAFGCLRSDVIYEVEANGRWGPWLLKLPKAVIANSESAKTNVSKYGIGRDHVDVLPNVIDLDVFDRIAMQGAKVDSSDDAPTAITICRMTKTKRLDRFLDALHQANQRTAVKGVLVGDGPERERMEERARNLNLLPDRVRFLGWRNDIPSLLRDAEMMVICSDHEGFPNVLLEAMAAGIPAIGTPAGDIPRVIDDNVTGCLVPFDGVTEMADRMVQLARDSRWRRDMGVAARNRVEQKFSLGSLAPRLMEIYRNAATTQGRTAIEPLLSIT